MTTSVESGGDGGDNNESITHEEDGDGGDGVLGADDEVNFKSSCSRRLLKKTKFYLSEK